MPGPVLEYERGDQQPPMPHSRRRFAVRFFAGIASFAFVAGGMYQLAANKVLRHVGLGRFEAAFLWLIGLTFAGLVINLQRKRRWTGFAAGVVTGVALTLIGLGVAFVVLLVELSHLRTGGDR